MHELSRCKSLIEQIQNSISEYAEYKIKTITVLVGELSQIDLDEFVELFPLAAKGTFVEKAELIVKKDPAKYSCANCSQLCTPKGSDLYCTFCQSSQLTLISGTEFMLDSIELTQ